MKRQPGVVTGLVHKVDTKQGRVMVKYRGIEERLLSPWAYIAAPLSGKGRGALFMPEEGDEVLVCYGDDEFARPYVVGFLWNGKQTSPETEPHFRVIVTPGGHQLRFEDKKGDKRVILTTDGKHHLTMDDKNKSVTLESGTGHHKLEIKDDGGTAVLMTKSGGKITLEDSGKATVEASNNIITLDSRGITIESKAGMVKVKSMAPMTIESTAAMNVTAKAAMTVMSSGLMNIQATAGVNLNAGTLLNVTAALANFSGFVHCNALITTAVASAAYVPTYGTILP